MNNEIYRNELIKYIEDMYVEFNEYQELAYKTLLEFCRVCDKNNISYQLAYGSLLGAIRDNGQIPWDYDIDVFVPYNEKDKLIDALKNDLSDEYYVASPEFNKKVRHNMPRITPKGWNSRYLHVDVFYLIGLPNDTFKRKRFCKKIKKICKVKKIKLTNIDEEITFSNQKKLKKIYCNILKIINSVYSIKLLDRKYDKLCNLYKIDNAQELTTGDRFADWYIFPNSMLQTKKIKIGSNEFNIPKNYEEVLNIIYGNYKEILPIEKRFNEMKKHFDILHSEKLKSEKSQ